MRLISSFFMLAFMTVVSAPALAVLKLTPQSVVDLALKQSLADFSIDIQPGYTYNEAENIQQTGDAVNEQLNLSVTLAKRFETGTALSLTYLDNRLSRTPNAFATNPGVSAGNLTSLTLGLRQNLLANFFGRADRLTVDAYREQVDSALENREEQLEGRLLDVMTLYWRAYIAEQQLKENLAAREKYSQLVQNVRRKAGFNLSSPGELPRLVAEQEATESKVKASSTNYLNAVQDLLTALRVETKEQIVLDVPTEIPPVPQLAEKSPEDLRVVRIGKMNLDVADKTLTSVVSRALPTLDLIASAATTGSEPKHGDAIAEMAAATKPTYYVGLQLQTPIGTTTSGAQIANANVLRQIAETNYLAAVDTAKQALENSGRLVLAQYSVAKLSIDVVSQRERVVRELEAAYRQGRQPLVELIRAYNDLFQAQLDRATAIGNYHIGLNQLAAARDELVTTVKK